MYNYTCLVCLYQFRCFLCGSDPPLIPPSFSGTRLKRSPLSWRRNTKTGLANNYSFFSIKSPQFSSHNISINSNQVQDVLNPFNICSPGTRCSTCAARRRTTPLSSTGALREFSSTTTTSRVSSRCSSLPTRSVANMKKTKIIFTTLLISFFFLYCLSHFISILSIFYSLQRCAIGWENTLIMSSWFIAR